MKNSIVSISVFVQIVWRCKMINLHDGFYKVYSSILYYLLAAAYKLYNSIVRTRWRVPGTQYTVYNGIFD